MLEECSSIMKKSPLHNSDGSEIKKKDGSKKEFDIKEAGGGGVVSLSSWEREGLPPLLEVYIYVAACVFCFCVSDMYVCMQLCICPCVHVCIYVCMCVCTVYILYTMCAGYVFYICM